MHQLYNIYRQCQPLNFNLFVFFADYHHDRHSAGKGSDKY